jgi:pimeloyl-ACP methyl ester carboxylesterase
MPRFTTSDGVAIAYDFDDSAPGDAPPVVLLHGFAVDSTINWHSTGIADGLADADRKTLTVDARGHGHSAKPHDPGMYGEGRMAEDVRELIDSIGLSSYDLVGYSMGAVTALLVAARDHRVRRLVVGGVGAGIVEVGGLDQRELPGGILASAFLAEDPAMIDHPLGQAWRAFATTLGADLKALGAQTQAMHTGGVALAAIRAPTLILAGDRDNLAVRPEVLAERLSEATVRMLPKADHLGAPAHPGFLAALTEFLGE